MTLLQKPLRFNCVRVGLDKAVPIIKRRLPYWLCAASAFALTITSGIGSAQDKALARSTVFSAAAYSRLLDTIFPQEHIASLKLAYTLILRFEPNEGTDSQLLFRIWHDTRVEAQLSTVKTETAWKIANTFKAQTGREDIEAVAALIPVEKHRLEISFAEIEKWHLELFDVLRRSESALQKAAAGFRKDGTTQAVLDGARYDLWLFQGETECHWSFSDIDLNDVPARANLPLARWMNTIRISSVKNE